MADLGALLKTTVAMLHQILCNGVLLDMGISILGPIPILLLAAIGQACKAGFHLVGKVIHMITPKVMGKQEIIQLAAILLLLGQHFKVDFVRHALEVFHSKYHQC